jgi:putative ABC transport system permease protein
MVRARVEVGPDRRLPLSLFVVEDFDAMRVEIVSREAGAWPPPTGAMLLDRSSAALLNAQIGANMTVSTANGVPRSVQVAGVVFDSGVAPAWQEQTGYAYITPATLSLLGEQPELDLLKVAFKDVPLDAAVIERKAQALSAWLTQQGAVVEESRIPPPGQHPHQRLMSALAMVLLLFGVLALALSGLLVATMISAMLTRHVRQIGAMKAIGALPGNIGVMYGAMVAAIGATAAVVAVLPSVIAGQQLAAVYADLSNVALVSRAIPWWVYSIVAVAGVLTPLLAAWVPVAGASRMTVREAISEAGMYQGPTPGLAASGRAMARRAVTPLGPTLVLALRHAVRRRRRLALSLLLLAVGGGAFMSGLNVAASSDRKLQSGITTLGYDLELNLSQAQQTDALLRLVRSVPGVAYVEPVGFSNVAPVQPGEVPVVGTHKDGGHGTVRLYSLPADTRYQPSVQSGCWLEPGDVDAIVVAPSELGRFGTELGGSIVVSIAGRISRWRVVGVMPGSRVPFGGAPGLYVSAAGYAQVTGAAPGTTRAVRVVTAEHDTAARQGVLRGLERAFTAQGIGVAQVVEAEWFATVLRNHMAIVQGGLQTLGIVLGVVGALTLASAMSLSVVERTREFGVMQTIGATPARVVWGVVAEGLVIGGVSWLGAFALALLLSSLVGGLVGSAIFGTPLPVVVAPLALPAWLVVALVGSAAASALPARAAARLTIRETLAYA